MKKFKHRKTGEIAIYKDGVLKSSGFSVEIGVEPSSNFWEEVVEKDYEILSFIGRNAKIPLRILNKHTNLYKHVTTNNAEELTEKYLLSGVGYKIHSIKRLSDGEI